MFKFQLNQEVWYIKNNKLCSSIILSRKYIDNCYSTEQRFQKQNKQRNDLSQFGKECILYSTADGIFPEDEIEESKVALFDNFIKQPSSISIFENFESFEFSDDFYDII